METFAINPSSTAVVSVDMHRGHLDPSVATLPLAWDRCGPLVERTRQLLDGLRAVGVPVVHIVSTYREVGELSSSPIWFAKSQDPNATRKNQLGHNLVGLPGTEVIPDLLHPGDTVLTTKKRYSSFQGTELEWLLRSRLGADTIVLTGVNTNTCVQCAAFDAVNRDFRVVVASDCVDSMDGEDMHRFALQNMEAALAWVWSNDTILAMADEEARTAAPLA